MKRLSMKRPSMNMRLAGSTFLVILATMVGGGCGGDVPTSDPVTTAGTVAPPTTSPTTTGATATSPSTTLAATATTSTATSTSGEAGFAPGPIVFRPLGDGVLVEATQSYNNPGVIIEHGGLWHMFSNDFRAWPGLVKVRHYSSVDGVVLEEATGTVFTSERSPFDAPQITIGGYVSDDGVWSLYFHTFNGNGQPSVIGRASADAPEGPWTVHDEAVLEPGAEGSWDELRVTRPSIVDSGDSLLMYYLGEDADGSSGIGVATSVDGVVWTKHPVPLMVAEGWEEFLERPDVVRTDTGFVMIYRGSVQAPWA